MRKYAISFFICAIIGAFISIFSIWILMLHTFVFGLLGLSIGYLMYGIIDYRIKFWEDFLPVLFAAIVMAAVMMFIIGAIFHTPNLYAYIYCLTIIFIMDLLGEHRDKLNNEEYFTSALIFGTISICIYIAFVHNKISLVYCGISGLTGIFITGFVTSSLFRWVILALGWSAGIVIPISISYYLIKEFPEISTGTKLGIIILIVLIASGYYKLGKLFYKKLRNSLTFRQRKLKHRKYTTSSTQTKSKRRPKSDEFDIKFIGSPIPFNPNVEEQIKIGEIAQKPKIATKPIIKSTAKSYKPKNLSAEAKLIPEDRIGCKCPVCQEDFEYGEYVIHCPICDAIYHDRGGDDNCWKYNNNKCAIFGCGE